MGVAGAGAGTIFGGAKMNWTNYWSTRTPSALSLTVISDTQIDGTFTINGTGQDGHKVYISTDGVTYTLNQALTGADNTFSATGLTAGTLYYFYATAYKASEESPASNISSGLTYTPELLTYITGLVTPLSQAQLLRLEAFISTLKLGLGITHLEDAFDIMYIFAGETEESSLKNLVKNAHHCTAVNAPTFTALEGFTGDGLSSYIDSNYNPSTVGNKFTLNDASIGIYIRTNDGLYSTSIYNIGIRALSYVNIIGERSNGLIRATINSTAANQPVFAGNVGLASYVRYGAASSYGYGNKVQSIEYTEASTSIPDGNIFILAASAIGNPVGYSKEQHSFAFAGKSVTSGQINIIVDAIEAYMDANGKGVL